MRSIILFVFLLLAHGLPAKAATVAVQFDLHEIRPVVVEGVADRATGRLVTADDPVRIASVSKLVTSLAVLRLSDQGKVDLDRDVSAYLGWRLRNPAFPEAPITLRALLSHQASLRDGDDQYIIPLGQSLRDRLADPVLWDRDHGPSSGWFAYANMNFPVVAAVVERVTGQRFDRATHQLVLKPLRLDACFNWGAGCSGRALRHAVVLYRASGEVARDDLKGRPPLCPVVVAQNGSCDLSHYRLGDNGALFSPQGGLRISMVDLARIGQMLANKGRGFLSSRAYDALTRAQWQAQPGTFGRNGGMNEYGQIDGSFCAYGLGLQRIGAGGQGCRDDLFGDGKLRLGHAGEAYGLRSGLWWDPATKRGVAYFITEMAEDAAQGRSAFSGPEEALMVRATAAPAAK
ncbi:MAG: serine hydrolase domain-containing protein [Chakrabartia sp.]